MKIYDFIKEKQIKHFELTDNFNLKSIQPKNEIEIKRCFNCGDNRCTILDTEFGCITQWCFVCDTINFVALKGIGTGLAVNLVYTYEEKNL